MNSTNKITNFRGVYEFLSNFWIDKFNDRTNEHFFQAMKTTDWREQLWVLNASTAGAAKRRGRRVTLRPDWDEIKDDVMLESLRLKFKHSPLRNALLATEDDELIEGNTWGDKYWGMVRGKGQNKLGKLLMQVRDEIRKELNGDFQSS